MTGGGAWATENQAVYVVTGSALQQGIRDTIGASQISAPRYYYKAVLDNTPPKSKAIGFLVPNRNLLCQLSRHAVPIDSLESTYSYRFYPLLADSQEQKLVESHLQISQ